MHKDKGEVHTKQNSHNNYIAVSDRHLYSWKPFHGVRTPKYDQVKKWSLKKEPRHSTCNNSTCCTVFYCFYSLNLLMDTVEKWPNMLKNTFYHFSILSMEGLN